MNLQHFGELVRFPTESQPVAEADYALLGRTAAAPPASGTADLPNGRDWFRVNWQKKVLLSVLILGATIAHSPASGRFTPAEVPADESSQRHSTLIAKLESRRTASAAEIEKARQPARTDHMELAQLETQVSEAARAPSSDTAALDRQLVELAAEIEKLRQQITADRSELAQLRAQVSEAAQAPSPDATMLHRQLIKLVRANT